METKRKVAMVVSSVLLSAISLPAFSLPAFASEITGQLSTGGTTVTPTDNSSLTGTVSPPASSGSNDQLTGTVSSPSDQLTGTVSAPSDQLTGTVSAPSTATTPSGGGGGGGPPVGLYGQVNTNPTAAPGVPNTGPSVLGTSTATGIPSTPGVPNTGAGGNGPMTIVTLILSSLLAAAGIFSLLRTGKA